MQERRRGNGREEERRGSERWSGHREEENDANDAVTETEMEDRRSRRRVQSFVNTYRMAGREVLGLEREQAAEKEHGKTVRL